MKKLISVFAAATAMTLASLPTSASAANAYASKPVSEVTVWADGALTVDLDDGTSNNYFLCYVDKPLVQSIPGSDNTTTTNTLTSLTCQGWQALATAAQLSGRPLMIQWFTSGTQGERTPVRVVRLGK